VVSLGGVLNIDYWEPVLTDSFLVMWAETVNLEENKVRGGGEWRAWLLIVMSKMGGGGVEAGCRVKCALCRAKRSYGEFSC
jgi:hypothetical protein